MSSKESIKRMAEVMKEEEIYLRSESDRVYEIDEIDAIVSNLANPSHMCMLLYLQSLAANYDKLSAVDKENLIIYNAGFMSNVFNCPASGDMDYMFKAVITLGQDVKPYLADFARVIEAILSNMTGGEGKGEYEGQPQYQMNLDFARRIMSDCAMGKTDNYDKFFSPRNGDAENSFSNSLTGRYRDENMRAWHEVNEKSRFLDGTGRSAWDEVYDRVKGIQQRNTEAGKYDPDTSYHSAGFPYLGHQQALATLIYLTLVKRFPNFVKKWTNLANVMLNDQKKAESYSAAFNKEKADVLDELSRFKGKVITFSMILAGRTSAEVCEFAMKIFGVEFKIPTESESYMDTLRLSGKRLKNLANSYKEDQDVMKIAKMEDLPKLIRIIAKLYRIERITWGTANPVDESQHLARKVLSAQFGSTVTIKRLFLRETDMKVLETETTSLDLLQTDDDKVSESSEALLFSVRKIMADMDKDAEVPQAKPNGFGFGLYQLAKMSIPSKSGFDTNPFAK